MNPQDHWEWDHSFILREEIMENNVIDRVMDRIEYGYRYPVGERVAAWTFFACGIFLFLSVCIGAVYGIGLLLVTWPWAAVVVGVGFICWSVYRVANLGD